MRVVVALGLSTVLTIGVAAVAGASKPTAALKAKALALSNMPSGWSVDNNPSGNPNSFSGCLKQLESQGNAKPNGLVRVRVQYEDGQTPGISEVLVSGKGAAAHYRAYVSVMNSCKQVGFNDNGTEVKGSAGQMSFPTVGDASDAYAFTFSVKGFNLGLDVVVFKVGNIDGDIAYEDLGSPDASTVEDFVTAAINKIQGKPVTTPTDAF
jgi:hypothetical protein